MKKISVFFALAGVVLCSQALFSGIAVAGGISLNVGNVGTFHVRGYAGDSTGTVVVLIKTTQEIEFFGDVNQKTEIGVNGEKQTISGLQQLEGKTVVVYGERSGNVLRKITIFVITAKTEKSDSKLITIFKRGFLNMENSEPGSMVWVSTVGSDFHQTRAIEEIIPLGKTTAESAFFINGMRVTQKKIWLLNGTPDLQSIYCVSESGVIKEFRILTSW